MDFSLPVLSHSIRISPSGMLDLKNVGFAVRISVISCVLPCLEAEIHAFEVFWPPSWIFSLPVMSHSIRNYSNGEIIPNLDNAVGISKISCLRAEIQRLLS